MSSLQFDADEWLAARQALQNSLDEDDAWDDLTTQIAVPPTQLATANVVAREACVLAGVEAIAICFEALDADVEVEARLADGQRCAAGQSLASLRGPLPQILAAERSFLNLLALLSGTATLTRSFVDAVGLRSAILDTRKTIPGLRRLQKYAVRCGGGRNHRLGLADGFLLKDNHRWSGLDLAASVQAVRRTHPDRIVVIEVDSMPQLEEALKVEPDRILLDNFDDAQVEAALRLRTTKSAKVPFEASGGIDLERALVLSGLGVEFLSVGALTHSARSIDFGLDLDRHD